MCKDFERYEGILLETLNNFTMIKEEYEYCEDRTEELTKFIKQDMRHILEFANLSGSETMQLVSVFKNKLKERRDMLENKYFLKRIHNLFKKYKDFEEEVEYVLGKLKIAKNKREEKKYYAKSELGQQLIDQFGKESDGMVKSVNEDDLRDLKKQLEGA